MKTTNHSQGWTPPHDRHASFSSGDYNDPGHKFSDRRERDIGDHIGDHAIGDRTISNEDWRPSWDRDDAHKASLLQKRLALDGVGAQGDGFGMAWNLPRPQQVPFGALRKATKSVLFFRLPRGVRQKPWGGVMFFEVQETSLGVALASHGASLGWF